MDLDTEKLNKKLGPCLYQTLETYNLTPSKVGIVTGTNRWFWTDRVQGRTRIHLRDIFWICYAADIDIIEFMTRFIKRYRQSENQHEPPTAV